MTKTLTQDVFANAPEWVRSAAAFITSTPNSLQKWRSTGRYKIPFFKVGRKIYYYKRDLVAFIFT